MRRTKLKPSDIPAKMHSCGAEIHLKLENLKKKEDEDLYGAYQMWDQLIKIDHYHPRETLKDTIVHEWLHSVLHLSGVSALMDDKEGLEEAVVRAVTSNILRAIDLEKLCVPATLPVIDKSA
jgi:hypothetical protein